MTTQKHPVVTIRTRAFSGHGVELVRCLVSGGEVLVWDAVARHYTSCHSMNSRAVAIVRRRAAKAVARA
jgi:hypothetical protein